MENSAVCHSEFKLHQCFLCFCVIQTDPKMLRSELCLKESSLFFLLLKKIWNVYIYIYISKSILI